MTEINRQFTDQELAKCAKRELSHRRHVYYRLTLEGKMDRKTADEEIAMMKQISEYFEAKAQPRLL
jgi:hypothetical protein